MESLINNKIIKESKLVRLASNYNEYLTNFDCLNIDENFTEQFNSRKRKKFKKHSKDINRFLVDIYELYELERI